MRRGVVSEAMDKMSDKYKLEALELLNQAEISEITNMKNGKSTRKIITVGLAASLTLALGVSVAAANGVFSMNVREADPSETITHIVQDYDEESDTIYEYEETVSDIENIITFEGPDSCYGIEFKLGYVPEVNIAPGGEFGDPYGWNSSFLQFETNNGGVNITVYYDPQFGENGCLFFNDSLYDIEESVMGEYDVYQFSDSYIVEFEDFDENPDHYDTYYTHYIIMHHPDGYIIVFSGSEDMDILKQIAENLEIQHTDDVVETEDFSNHNFSVIRGLG